MGIALGYRVSPSLIQKFLKEFYDDICELGLKGTIQNKYRNKGS